MLFKSAETNCLLQILKILEKGKTKYGKMFRETKVSHTTLQTVLKYLIEKKFIKRQESSYKIVDYEINERGKGLLKQLVKLKEIL